MKIRLIDDGLKIKYVPAEEDINACYELGKKIADELPN